jgi:hypothetical protein
VSGLVAVGYHVPKQVARSEELLLHVLVHVILMRYRRGLSGAIALLGRTVADAAARGAVEFGVQDD